MIDSDLLRRLPELRTHVVGVSGSEGTALARWLAARGVRQLVLHDSAEEEALRRSFRRAHVGHGRERDRLWEELRALAATWRVGAAYLDGIADADLVALPQSWFLHTANREALEPLLVQGTPTLGLMDLYFALAPCRRLAVTGSMGKSTTSRLVEHLLRAAGLKVWYAGNERRGTQVLDRLEEMKPDHWMVLEVSNRHLRGMDFGADGGPEIGVLTNVTPNHLDEHDHDFAQYAAVKRRLLANQPAEASAVVNAHDPTSVELAEGLPGRVLRFSTAGPVPRGAWLEGDEVLLRLHKDGPTERLRIEAPSLPGAHNRANILAAVLASRLAGADVAAMERALPRFRGLRHRIQLVWSHEGVDYYDDLNATTPQATVAALRALEEDIILIAGGDDKGLPLEALCREIRTRVRRVILLPGAGSDRMASALRATVDGVEPMVERYDDLAAAVRSAVASARPGERVLLSPACPYFFRMHYVKGGAERGYKALLREITLTTPADEEAPVA